VNPVQESHQEIDMVDMHLEVNIVPVSDADRAKKFYQHLGWRLDDDVAPADGVRIIQLTPPGSACSITFGSGITTASPGSVQGTLVVSDIEAAHDDLVSRGIETSEIFHGAPFPKAGRLSGPHPERQSYGSFVTMTDPDGNEWFVQEVTTRLPGRG
jgi:predicted enzyme related to lactoylglutathione lyase